MDETLRRLDFGMPYIDDTSAASKNSDQHKMHVPALLERLSSHEIVACVFGVTEVEFFGHVINKDGVSSPKSCV